MFIYSIRLTLDDDEKVLDVFKDYECLIVKEGPDTECPVDHYHMIMKTDLKIPALRMRIRNAFTMKGNKDYSIKQPKDEDEQDAAVRYTCKGTKSRLPTVIKNIGYDTDEYYRRYWEVNKNAKQRKGKPKEECIKFLSDYYADYNRPFTEEDICDRMLAWYYENDYQIPHRTVGTSIIKYMVYHLKIFYHKDIMHRYYGVTFNS